MAFPLAAALAAAAPAIHPGSLFGSPVASAAERLVVGITSLSPGAMPLYAAREKGLFEAEGLTVDLVVFRSGTENAQAILANEVQIGIGNILEVFTIRKAGQDARCFWSVANLMPYKLYARPEVQSPRDLKGKKLAISKFGAQTGYLTQHTLRHFGIGPIKDAAILQKYLKYERPAAEAGYREFSRSLAADGRIPAKGIELLIGEGLKAGNLKEPYAAAGVIATAFIEQFARALSRPLKKAHRFSPLPWRQRLGRWRARTALRRTAQVRLRPASGGRPRLARRLASGPF
jgi:hypothetical protein